MKAPSIFNDVLGPVMRGPSSSHSAACVRIGWIARAIMGGNIREVLVQFDRSGSLPTTHDSQGSDMGLFGGLLGYELSDNRLLSVEEDILSAGIRVSFETGDYGDRHPNTYRLSLKNDREIHDLVAISTGGGMIEVLEIDGNPVSFSGDLHETIIFVSGDPEGCRKEIFEAVAPGTPVLHASGDIAFWEVKTHKALEDNIAYDISCMSRVLGVKQIPPVLPIPTPEKISLPFHSCSEMLEFQKGQELSLGELGLMYECGRSGLRKEELLERMTQIVRLLKKQVRAGISGTEFRDRILGAQSGTFVDCRDSGSLLDLGILNLVIPAVTALMEMKSSMGVIVAAPTAGSCGALPGAVLGAGLGLEAGEKEMAMAFMAAGMIGIFIAEGATFSAEVGGCQAECGSGSGMAAASLVNLMGGTPEQAVAAASMALQSSLGMICDPVANRVEVPCLGKNVMAAGNALSCANMALAGFDPVVPLDEVVSAMDRVGRSIAHELRCTGLGGLSTTETSLSIKKTLESS